MISRKIFSLLFFASGISAAAAAPTSAAEENPYLPLRQGSVTIFDYRFHVETSRKEFKASDTQGKMITTYERTELKNGKSYLRSTTSYKNIPYMTTEAVIWRREENGDVFIASELNGKFSETLEIPRNPTLGTEWDYYDGELSKRKVTAKLELEFAGKKYSDCIEVSRAVLKNEKLKAADNRNYYCAGVGEVRFLFRQPSPVGDYITETSMLEHTVRE